MTKDNRQNDVNQNGGREHEHPHGEALPHQPQQAAEHRHGEKQQGHTGQANFIPGEAPVGQQGRTKGFRKAK